MEETCMGLRCIAAVGMTSRLTDDRLSVLGRTVREVAAELTLTLGGVTPETKSS
jgi:IclR family transcriptional regulator, acetate operon repressor